MIGACVLDIDAAPPHCDPGRSALPGNGLRKAGVASGHNVLDCAPADGYDSPGIEQEMMTAPHYDASDQPIHRESAPVVDIAALSGGHCRVRVRAPAVAAAVKPGQFVNVSPPLDSAILRRPLGVYRTHDASDIELLFKIVGRGTVALAAMKPGADPAATLLSTQRTTSSHLSLEGVRHHQLRRCLFSPNAIAQAATKMEPQGLARQELNHLLLRQARPPSLE